MTVSRYSYLLTLLIVALMVWLWWALDKWLFAQLQTWLFYYQTFVAGVFAIVAAMVSLGGLWWVTEKQIHHGLEKEQRDRDAMVSSLSNLLTMDGQNAFVTAMMVKHDLSENPHRKLMPKVLDPIYPNYFTEIALLPGELGGAFIQAMSRYQMLRDMLESPLEKNEESFPQQRLNHANLVALEAKTTCDWLNYVSRNPRARLTIAEAKQKFLSQAEQQAYSDAVEMKHGL